MEKAGVDDPITVTCAVSDGNAVYALRYASAGDAPSLFYGCGARPQRAKGDAVTETESSILILSEPLDHFEEQWNMVPESHILIAGDGGVAMRPIKLTAPSSTAA